MASWQARQRSRRHRPLDPAEHLSKSLTISVKKAEIMAQVRARRSGLMTGWTSIPRRSPWEAGGSSSAEAEGLLFNMLLFFVDDRWRYTSCVGQSDRGHKVQRTTFEYVWWQNYYLKTSQHATTEAMLAGWNVIVFIIKQPTRKVKVRKSPKPVADAKVCEWKPDCGPGALRALVRYRWRDASFPMLSSSFPGWRNTDLKIFSYRKFHRSQQSK